MVSFYMVILAGIATCLPTGYYSADSAGNHIGMESPLCLKEGRVLDSQVDLD